MDDLLTTRQVLDILKVDRITVYRMLQDGRIKGVKVGGQWRFPSVEVERILGGSRGEPEAAQLKSETNGFPTHCVQAIQDLFSDVGLVSSLVTNAEGEPLTAISHPCRFCQVILQNPSGNAACRASWREFTRQSAAGSRYFTCHAGLQYISAPIEDGANVEGYFLAGEFHWQPANPQEEAERIQRLAAGLNIAAETLAQASGTVPVIAAEQHAQVEAWPKAAARAVQSILLERISFIERLQQIADLTKI